MSFIRPEARAALWRWRDVIAGGMVLAFGVYWGLGSGGILSWIGYALIVAGLAMAFSGLQRGRFLRSSQNKAPGVIELDERQLTYFGVDVGVIVPLGAVTRIEIEPAQDGASSNDAVWRFTTVDGGVARIPASALGSERLFDALAAFPGADYEKVIAVSGKPGGSRLLVWQKNVQIPHRTLH